MAKMGLRSAKCEIKKLFPTPFGWAGVAASAHGITRVVLPKKSRKAVERELISAKCSDLVGINSMRSAENLCTDDGALDRGVYLLRRYFSGEQVAFDLPIDISYYTAFQQSVWRAAMEIPFGETRPYGWIAKNIRRPLAARAVGQAMGANPVPVIIP